jgi:hypothetical protein
LEKNPHEYRNNWFQHEDYKFLKQIVKYCSQEKEETAVLLIDY